MARETPSAVDVCKATVLVEDAPSKGTALIHRHGLSFLIEAASGNSKSKVLLDAGPSPEAIANNVKALNLRLDDLNVVAISHGHYDHMDGLIEVLKHASDPVPVIIHPKVFDPKFAYKPNLTYIGPKFDPSSIKSVGGVLVPTASPLLLAGGIVTSGEIPLETGFEKPKGFWKVEDNVFVEDLMVDEQALVINLRAKGLVIIVGCAHRGLINTVKHAQRITKESKVHAIVGGFHLLEASDEAIHSTVRELKEIAPSHIYPCHCTGKKAISELAKVFGGRCQPIRTGDEILLK